MPGKPSGECPDYSEIADFSQVVVSSLNAAGLTTSPTKEPTTTLKVITGTIVSPLFFPDFCSSGDFTISPRLLRYPLENKYMTGSQLLILKEAQIEASRNVTEATQADDDSYSLTLIVEVSSTAHWLCQW